MRFDSKGNVMLLISLMIGAVLWANEASIVNQLHNTQEQFMRAYTMTVELRRLLTVIFVLGGLRALAVVVRIVCYISRIKIPVWLDMLL